MSLEQGLSTNDNELDASARVFSGYLGKRCSLEPSGRLEAVNRGSEISLLSWSLSDTRGTWRPRLFPHTEATHAPFSCLGMALEYLLCPSLSRLSTNSCCGKAWCRHGYDGDMTKDWDSATVSFGPQIHWTD